MGAGGAPRESSCGGRARIGTGSGVRISPKRRRGRDPIACRCCLSRIGSTVDLGRRRLSRLNRSARQPKYLLTCGTLHPLVSVAGSITNLLAAGKTHDGLCRRSCRAAGRFETRQQMRLLVLDALGKFLRLFQSKCDCADSQLELAPTKTPRADHVQALRTSQRVNRIATDLQTANRHAEVNRSRAVRSLPDQRADR